MRDIIILCNSNLIKEIEELMENKSNKIIALLAPIIIILLSVFVIIALQSPNRRVAKEFDGIVCWGDSLTEGTKGDGVTYPKTIQGMIRGRKFVVANCGVGAENAPTIVCRSGGMKFVITEDITIPEGTEPVDIVISAEDGHPVNPLRRYPGNEWEVTITDKSGTAIPGILRVEQEAPEAAEFHYTFRRNEPGKSGTVAAGTAIHLKLYDTYKNYETYYPVIFIGQNGGWDSPEDLIYLQKQILSKYGNGTDYLIVGLHTGTREERKDVEEALEKEYGDRFLNLREYMSTEGLKKAGIEPTDEDKSYMANGMTPPSLLSDGLHFNSTGYRVLGEAILDRIEDNLEKKEK